MEIAGVEFTDENGGGPDVRLRRPPACPKNSSQGVCYFTGVGAGNRYIENRWTYWHLVSKARTSSGPAPFCHKWGAGFFYQLFYFAKSANHQVVNVDADFVALCSQSRYDVRFSHC